MNGIFYLVFLVLGLLCLLIMGYLYFLAIASLWPEKRKKREFPTTTKFAIVVPAHNESKVLLRTLESLKRLDYPKDLYEIIVVADNCSDNTAEIARQSGIICWERKDLLLRGKGHVLKWAFDHLIAEGDHEAYVVMDADTLMDGQFLRVMNQTIHEGAKAVQGYYDVLQPERSPMASLSYLGFVLSRNFRYRGRTRLGWTTNLLGNGMCFTREVIEKFGWCATSIVEDIEYEMILHLNGIRVVFAPEARVYAEIPDTFDTSRVQRGRWDMGKFRVRNKYLFKLLREGFRKKDLSYFDAALELLIPPFSIFVMILFAGFLLFLLLNLHGPTATWLIWVSLMIGLGIYTMGGLCHARTNLKVYLNLMYAPYFILWRIGIILQEVWHRNHGVWVKTERK